MTFARPLATAPRGAASGAVDPTRGPDEPAASTEVVDPETQR